MNGGINILGIAVIALGTFLIFLGFSGKYQAFGINSSASTSANTSANTTAANNTQLSTAQVAATPQGQAITAGVNTANSALPFQIPGGVSSNQLFQGIASGLYGGTVQ